MRIWITGSHWTWKTSILNKLETKLPKISEVARELIEKKWVLPHNMSDDDRSEFQFELLLLQMQKEVCEFISDRTIFDVLAYSKWLRHYDSMVKMTRYYLDNNPYDLVFYIPIEFDMETDGVRKEDEEYRKEIDKNILELLTEFNVKYITIKWSLDERIKNINRAINF
jgi:nicotinamide riboside kinase